jgi:hypothetical protein
MRELATISNRQAAETAFEAIICACEEWEAKVKAQVSEKNRPFFWDALDNARGMRKELWRVSDDKLIWLYDDLKRVHEDFCAVMFNPTGSRAKRLIFPVSNSAV